MTAPTIPQNSFKYRMGAGIPGDVNRSHPASIEPNFNDATNPVVSAGLACLVNSAKNGVRQVAAGDTGVTKIYGVTVRAYPTQDKGTAYDFGGQAQGLEPLPAGQNVDVLRSGYINAPIVGTPGKNDPVYVWVAAASGAHIQGGFEASASGGNTAAIANAFFNGAPDSNGYGEIVVNVD